uniref:RING-type domain-containing protein n=1 Tax=Corethron hystrix TaxID=216773 RepID=A0A7S1BW70_9STRA|mmetsp:Transcript_4378/g.8506  ORF Transcript_4378/g.8506 Transcript_4378/m.8506 type:complete len:1063 (+) Transcript_4378:312-3500(+)
MDAAALSEPGTSTILPPSPSLDLAAPLESISDPAELQAELPIVCVAFPDPSSAQKCDDDVDVKVEFDVHADVNERKQASPSTTLPIANAFAAPNDASSADSVEEIETASSSDGASAKETRVSVAAEESIASFAAAAAPTEVVGKQHQQRREEGEEGVNGGGGRGRNGGEGRVERIEGDGTGEGKEEEEVEEKEEMTEETEDFPDLFPVIVATPVDARPSSHECEIWTDEMPFPDDGDTNNDSPYFGLPLLPMTQSRHLSPPLSVFTSSFSDAENDGSNNNEDGDDDVNDNDNGNNNGNDNVHININVNDNVNVQDDISSLPALVSRDETSAAASSDASSSVSVPADITSAASTSNSVAWSGVDPVVNDQTPPSPSPVDSPPTQSPSLLSSSVRMDHLTHHQLRHSPVSRTRDSGASGGNWYSFRRLSSASAVDERTEEARSHISLLPPPPDRIPPRRRVRPSWIDDTVPDIDFRPAPLRRRASYHGDTSLYASPSAFMEMSERNASTSNNNNDGERQMEAEHEVQNIEEQEQDNFVAPGNQLRRHQEQQETNDTWEDQYDALDATRTTLLRRAAGWRDRTNRRGVRRHHEAWTRSSSDDDESAFLARRRRFEEWFERTVATMRSLFNTVLIAILICWVILTITFVRDLSNTCNTLIQKFYWIATLQLMSLLLRTDILRNFLCYDPNINRGLPLPLRVVTLNLLYILFLLYVLLRGFYLAFIQENHCTQNVELFITLRIYISLHYAALAIVVFGYGIPICALARWVVGGRGADPAPRGRIFDSMIRTTSAGPYGGSGRRFPDIFTLGGTSAATAGTARTNRTMGMTTMEFPGTGDIVLPDNLRSRRNFSGAPPTFIDEMRQVKKADFLESYPTECCICMNDFEDEDVNVVTECNHVFHKDCFEEWLKMARTCPVCRHNLLGSAAGVAGLGVIGSSADVDGAAASLFLSADLRDSEFHQEITNLLRILRQYEERIQPTAEGATTTLTVGGGAINWGGQSSLINREQQNIFSAEVNDEDSFIAENGNISDSNGPTTSNNPDRVVEHIESDMERGIWETNSSTFHE